jgi:hypothetical protein
VSQLIQCPYIAAAGYGVCWGMFDDRSDEWWKTGSPVVRVLGFLGLGVWVVCTAAWFLHRYYATDEPIHSMAHQMMEIGWLALMGLLILFYCFKRRRQ